MKILGADSILQKRILRMGIRDFGDEVLTSTYGRLGEFIFYCCFLFTVPATSKNVEPLNNCGCVCLRDVTILRLSVGINGGYNFNNYFPEKRISLLIGREAGIKLFKQHVELTSILRFHLFTKKGAEYHGDWHYGFFISEPDPYNAGNGIDTVKYIHNVTDHLNFPFFDLGLKVVLKLNRLRIGFGGILNYELENSTTEITEEIYTKNGSSYEFIERKQYTADNYGYRQGSWWFYPGMLLTVSYQYKNFELLFETNINGIPRIGLFANWLMFPWDATK
ncbi:MAG TPA: hypothetical protein VHO70_11540 [Chitinispirillaceae bacterium]|nr:hypothetical protein [Chitinispirillaceae bacterium]